ncbi:MAG: hypothetical protein HYV37_01005 [Candidatus Levyibacteriota bacterium]|nr:MAG: hypothetical protein HYV37_01005 [Candidatus Levybacteria bacterium]
MRRKKRPLFLLLISILSFAALSYIVFSYSPSSLINIQKPKIDIPSAATFFVLVFIFFSSFSGYLFHNVRRGILLGTSIVVYLLLRFFGLRNIFFLIILIAIFATIELTFSQKK